MRVRRAFTLIELLVATTILAGLVAMASGVYYVYIRDSDEKILRYDLNSLRMACQHFYLDHGRYPLDGFDHWGNNVSFLDYRTSELTQGAHDGVNSYPPKKYRYLQEIPVDPTTNLCNWIILPHDSDGDWNPTTAPPHDVGMDGLAGTNDLGEGDGVPNRGEPHVDEDGVWPAGINDDGDAFTDEDPPDVMSLKSARRDFYDY